MATSCCSCQSAADEALRAKATTEPPSANGAASVDRLALRAALGGRAEVH
jgi:hypothetical protein